MVTVLRVLIFLSDIVSILLAFLLWVSIQPLQDHPLLLMQNFPWPLSCVSASSILYYSFLLEYILQWL